MTDENNLQSAPLPLAHDIWQRHVLSPGVIQTRPLLSSFQRNTEWLLSRTQFSMEVQRRWLPGSTSGDSGNGFVLPFVRSFSQLEKRISRMADPVAPAWEGSDSIPPDHFVGTQQEVKHRDENPAVQPNDFVQTQPVQIARSAAPSLRDSLLMRQPGSGATAASLSSLGSNPAGPMQSDVAASSGHTDIHATGAHLPAGTVHAKTPDGAAMISRMAVTSPTSPPTGVASSLLRAPQDPLGAQLIQRYVDGSPHADTRPVIFHEASAPSTSVPFGESSSHTSSEPNAMTHFASAVTFTHPIQKIERSIQKMSSTQAVSSPLSLARSVHIHASGSQLTGRIQTYPASDRPPRASSLPILIQRQPQASATPLSSSSVSPATSPTTSSAADHGTGNAVDVEKIAEEVLRILSTRMAVEGERRGIGSWL